jgi:hypothetical protein
VLTLVGNKDVVVVVFVIKAFVVATLVGSFSLDEIFELGKLLLLVLSLLLNLLSTFHLLHLSR